MDSTAYIIIFLLGIGLLFVPGMAIIGLLVIVAAFFLVPANNKLREDEKEEDVSVGGAINSGLVLFLILIIVALFGIAILVGLGLQI